MNTTANSTLVCFPPISPAEWEGLDTTATGPHQFTLTDPTTITITSTGDPADLFAAVTALVMKLGYLPPQSRKDPGGPRFTAPDGRTPFHLWRTFNGRIDVQPTGAVWGIWGHDVVDLHLEDPEPLLDLLNEINSGTVDELRRNYDDGYPGHVIDTLGDLADVLGEYHAGIAGAVSRETLFATLPPEGSQAYEDACELQLDALAAYTTGLLAKAIGITDAWKQRIAERAAERGITRCDLSDPTIQAVALRAQS